MNTAELIESTLTERGLSWERTGPRSFAVTLPGVHKLKTSCNLIVGEHALRIEAFVMRQPDENREQLWAWLLQRNARMYGVAFATGILTVFFDVADQSYLPVLVNREHLVEGNSKLEVSRSVAQITGPGVAGALVQLVTAPLAVAVDAASFVASVIFQPK